MQTLEKTEPKLQELRARLTEINDIESAASLLYWDQATYMLPGGAAALRTMLRYDWGDVPGIHTGQPDERPIFPGGSQG